MKNQSSGNLEKPEIIAGIKSSPDPVPTYEPEARVAYQPPAHVKGSFQNYKSKMSQLENAKRDNEESKTDRPGDIGQLRSQLPKSNALTRARDL